MTPTVATSIDHFLPSHRPDVFVDDVPGDLPAGATVVAVSQFFGGNSADGALVRVLDGSTSISLPRPRRRHDPRGGAVPSRRAVHHVAGRAGDRVRRSVGARRSCLVDVARRRARARRARRRRLSDRSVPGDAAVAIVMRQRPVMVAAELGAMSLGRTALLLSPLQADRALAAEVDSLRARGARGPRRRVGSPGVRRRRRIERGAGSRARRRRRADGAHRRARRAAGPVLDAAVTVLTSGTTGPPEAAAGRLGDVRRAGRRPRPAASRGRVKGALILSLPLVTLGGLLSMARLVFMGRPIAMMERFDVHTWAALVKEHRPNGDGCAAARGADDPRCRHHARPLRRASRPTSRRRPRSHPTPSAGSRRGTASRCCSATARPSS